MVKYTITVTNNTYLMIRVSRSNSALAKSPQSGFNVFMATGWLFRNPLKTSPNLPEPNISENFSEVPGTSHPSM